MRWLSSHTPLPLGSSCRLCKRGSALFVAATLMCLTLIPPAYASPYTFSTIDVPGSIYTTVYGINNAGQIVGSYSDAVDAPNHGFVYSGGIYTFINVPGAVSTLALGINDAGQIVGAYGDNINPGPGFLTQAVPEPAALSLFATGLGLMGWFARRNTRKTVRLAQASRAASRSGHAAGSPYAAPSTKEQGRGPSPDRPLSGRAWQ
jgi:probable HAF family extracellular repeat protein